MFRKTKQNKNKTQLRSHWKCLFIQAERGTVGVMSDFGELLQQAYV